MSDNILHKIFDMYKESDNLILWKNVKMILNSMNIDLNNTDLNEAHMISNNASYDFDKFKNIVNKILLKETQNISYKTLSQSLCDKYGDDMASYIMTITYGQGNDGDILVDPSLILKCLEDMNLDA